MKAALGIPAVLLLLAAALLAVWSPPWSPGPREALEASVPKPREDGFVSSDACQSCHPGQYATWHQSYHRTMTQVATPDVIAPRLADGETVRFDTHGQTGALTRRGDAYWVEMVDPEWEHERWVRGVETIEPDAPRTERRVVMTTGSHHFQVFWFPSERDGELWQFPWRYHIEEDRWVHRKDAFLQPPDMHMLWDFRVWNDTCIFCHSVAGQPGQNPESRVYDATRVGELGIACEACHGPAEAHVAQNRSPLARYPQHLGGEREQRVFDPKEAGAETASQICGACHGFTGTVRDASGRPLGTELLRTGLPYRPGDDLSRFAELRHPGDGQPYNEARFWSDGSCRAGGREFHGLVESPCYRDAEVEAQRLSCLSCHAMHQEPDDPRPPKVWADDQLARGMETNRACTQCHAPFEAEEALVAHTRHPAESSGSSCYNCHMPHTSYALFKAIRTHEIDSPEIAPFADNARPNACNLCHLDQTLAWSSRHLVDWYGHEPVALTEDERQVAASLLWLLSGDAGQRVILAWHLGWEAARVASDERWMAPFLAALLEDDYSAVRYVAWRSLKKLPGFEDFAYDFDAPVESRSEAAGRAVRTWQSLPGPAADAPNGRLLLRGRDLERDRFDRLVGQRSNRPTHGFE